MIKARLKNALAVILSIILVSSLSNYAPYYKYFLLICIIYYINIRNDLKLSLNK